MRHHSPHTSTLESAAHERLLGTLRSIDYPATKDDLLRIAVLDHLEVPTIDAIHELPTRDYHGISEVLKEIALD